MKYAVPDGNRFSALKITAIYAFVSGLWIYFSDTAVAWLVQDPVSMTHLSVSKGMFFIIVTSSLLYVLIRRQMNRLEDINRTLQERDKFLQSISANMPGVMYEFSAADDGAYRVNYVSRKATDVFGLPADPETFFPSFVARVAEEDRPGFLESIRRVVLTSSPWKYEGRFTKPDGETIWFQGTSTARREGERLLYSGVLLDVTERKQAEEAIEQHEEMYRSVIENIQDVFYRSDREGRLLMGSPSGIRLFGYDRLEDMVGARLDSFWVNPGDRERLIQEIRENGSVKDFEGLLKKKDGTVFHASFSAHFYRDDKGNILGTEGIIRDITEQKRTLEALRESERLYTSLVNTIPDMIVRTDLSGKVLFVNDHVIRISGYSREEIIGENLLRFVSVEDHERATQDIMLVREGALGPREYVMTTKDGKKIPFEVNGDVLCDEAGNPVGLVNVCREVTDRKKTEEALRQSERNFRNLSEASTVGISITDGERFLYCNPTVLRMSGFSEEEYYSKPIWEFVTPESRDTIMTRGKDRLSGKEVPPRYEIEVLTKSGAVKWAEVGAAIIEYNGKPAIIFTQYDITDRKAADAEREVLQKRLNSAQKMEALGQLAGGVAHDLNNVLGILTGYSELLLMEIPQGQPARRHVEKILESTEKGAAIVQDLLTMARRGVRSSDVINLNTVVSDFLKTPVFDKLKSSYPRVTFRTECQDALLNIVGSSVHLEKTLMNLVSNAAESISGQGEVVIGTENRYIEREIKGFDEVRQGDYVILTVSDSGIGILEEDRDKIFEPFYTRKKMGRSGTGLGLAIVWGTVKDHDGYIDVQSRPGEGSTFVLYFPVTQEEPIAAQQHIPMERYAGNGETILVVDDIAEQRDIASGLLRKLGYEIHAVSSGEEAVAFLENNKVDILVLDMIMDPGMDGLETYQRIIETRPGQKAVIVSGFSETDRVRAAQRLGAGAYVKKPYVLEKIGLAIREELDR